jgi:hypothetical protein
METITSTQHRIAATVAAAFLGATVLALTPSAAHATRLPADPITFVGTPVLLAQLVTEGHAATVRAAIQELRSDVG